MYKRKLFIFGFISTLVLLIALGSAAISAHLTRENLQQSQLAQRLLIEHQQLSSISYRLFKQLTDELIFGQNANQAKVRNKQQQISQSLSFIASLEKEQRQALGIEATRGSVEDTAGLSSLIDNIVGEFKSIIASQDKTPLAQQERVQILLENTIDNQFREAINAAVSRQSRVVNQLNTATETLNTAIVWFTAGLGLITFPFIILGCYWLFNQLYYPLNVINNGARALNSGDFSTRMPDTLDKEFSDLASTLNQLAGKMAEQESREEQSRQALEIEVSQRTQALSEANRQLTLQDTKRRQFLADVSHELRTPLTIIRGEAQVTLRQPNQPAEVYRHTLEAILSQAVSLSTLVDDLLLLARSEMSQLTLDIQPDDLTACVKDLTDRWQRQHPQRKIWFKDHTHSHYQQLPFDRQRVCQLLTILLDNATRYSDATQPITITIHAVDSHLSTSDTHTSQALDSHSPALDSHSSVSDTHTPQALDSHSSESDTHTPQALDSHSSASDTHTHQALDSHSSASDTQTYQALDSHSSAPDTQTYQALDSHSSAPDTHVNISISDRGQGISPTELERIFERFVRFKRQQGGVGLGLAIAKTLAEAHGGKLTATSVLNEGSVFTLTLPTGTNHENTNR